jgi:hypothetical protein
MNSSKPCEGRLISTRTKVESLSQRMKIRMLRRRLCIHEGFNEERWGGWRERNVQQSAPRSASQCYHTAIRQLFVSRYASFVSRRTDHRRSRTYLLQVFEDDVLWCMSGWSHAFVGRVNTYDGLNHHTLLAARHDGHADRVQRLGRRKRERGADSTCPATSAVMSRLGLRRVFRRPPWRSVCCFILLCAASFSTMAVIGPGALQLIDRGGGHIHYLRTGPKEEDESMGSYDRALRKRPEDS